MTSGYGPALRFSRSFMTGWAPVVEREIHIERDGRRLPASLLLPRATVRRAHAGRRQRAPVWVVLHGITRSGRDHPYLVRFARAVASTGQAVLVPEIPEWRDIQLSTEATTSTVAASLEALEGRPELASRQVGLVGFSFGAPQVIVAAADPSLAGRIAGVVAFGGYCSVEESARFQFTGVHELDGREESLAPDPYARWVVGANYLHRIPGHERAGRVAEALRALAAYTGDNDLLATDPGMEPVRQRLAEGLDAGERSLFEVLAPPTGCLPDPVGGARLAEGLGGVMARIPELNPVPYLARVNVPVRLLHGAGDQLFPYTQTIKLGRVFPPGADVTTTITGLFAHSSGGERTSLLRKASEALRFLHALASVFRLVRPAASPAPRPPS